MDDNSIIDMYWARNEKAIDATKDKYGHYCYSIAYGILENFEDAEECVNDTYLGAWNSIPPNKPQMLSTFLGKLTRNISLNRWRKKHRIKRGGGEVQLTLDELQECLPSGNTVEKEIEAKELAVIISGFLRELEVEERRIFLRRYWYFDSIDEICKSFGFGKSKVKMKLMRTRNKLLVKLKEEGVYL